MAHGGAQFAGGGLDEGDVAGPLGQRVLEGLDGAAFLGGELHGLGGLAGPGHGLAQFAEDSLPAGRGDEDADDLAREGALELLTGRVLLRLDQLNGGVPLSFQGSLQTGVGADEAGVRLAGGGSGDHLPARGPRLCEQSVVVGVDLGGRWRRPRP